MPFSLPTGHPFTDVLWGWYWSSTTYVNASLAWSVHFGGGNVIYGDKGGSSGAWCVRGGQ